MQRKDLLIGVLRPGGYLATGSGKMRLTGRREGGEIPESDPAFYTEGVGKIAVVAGESFK